MTTEPRHVDYGHTVSEWIALIPGELPLDAVGLWQIVPAGRDGFDLTGEALIDFVRRGVLALLDAGALPVRYRRGSGYDWTPQKQYGNVRDQIADAVITEWLAMPNDPLVLCGEGVWFAQPDPKPGSRYVGPCEG